MGHETHQGQAERGDSARAASALLGVGDVMARYGLRDRRAARRVMDAAGAFLVGRRLLVRETDLVAHEERLRAGRRAEQSMPPPPAAPPARRSVSGAGGRSSAPPLPAGWWRKEPG